MLKQNAGKQYRCLKIYMYIYIAAVLKPLV